MFKHVDFKTYPIYNFFKKGKITFTYDEGIDCYNNYKINNNCIILLDPPYLTLDNDFYRFKTGLDIYEYLSINKIEKEHAKIYLILQLNFIVSLLFNQYKIFDDKKYQTTKKNNTHCIYYNNKNIR